MTETRPMASSRRSCFESKANRPDNENGDGDVQNGRRGHLGDAKTYSLILFLVDIVLILQRTASSKNNLDAKSGLTCRMWTRTETAR